MSKPFDATTKDLLETAPADWLALLGQPRPAERVRIIDAELSTVTTAADKVIRIDDEKPWLLHIEIQSSWDDSLPSRMLEYSALLIGRHQLPVATVAVLLRPAANAGTLTGTFSVTPPLGPAWEFRYLVVRVWREPLARWLEGPLGILPLAPITDVDRSLLPAVISRMQQRLNREAPKPVAAKLWAATYVLLGLEYDQSFIDQLLEGVVAMEESTTYQAIIRKGEAREGRRFLLRQGHKRFGPPPPRVEEALAAITDVEQLELLGERLLDVKSWDELIPVA